MKFAEIERLIRGVPYTTAERGREIYDHVLKAKPERCLELGFAHGVSLCYVAAALHELGRGHIDGVDLAGIALDPSPETLLAKCGLGDFVTLHRERNSYTWFLKKRIEANSVGGICRTEYDLCYIDGPKNWTIDGAAFFMADKLLNPGGTIVFDDYSYAYGSEEGVTDGIAHRELADDERLEPQIKAVFHLLVMQHPDYGNFEVVNEQWGWATKTGGSGRELRVHERIGAWPKLMRRARRLRSR